MKKILVLYYTQTGQLKDILDNILFQIKEKVAIDYVKIEPEKDFPFPWTSDSFFDAMPESVLQIPIAIKPLPQEIKNKNYDLVIYGYQPWFLSPSIPSNSFLNSDEAILLKDKPVVTILGCRNMWLHAQETVKEKLKSIGANHVGHIVFQDNHPNLVSLKTTLRWFFKGQKEADAKLPEAGVAKDDMIEARKYGPILLQHLEENSLESLQEVLIDNNAIYINPALILLEGRGVSQFPQWAQRARDKGLQNGEDRKQVLKKFKRILIISIFVLSPLSNAGASLISAMRKKAMKKKADYFRSVTYMPDMI